MNPPSLSLTYTHICMHMHACAHTNKQTNTYTLTVTYACILKYYFNIFDITSNFHNMRKTRFVVNLVS